MGNVVDLAAIRLDRQPHRGGLARCLDCRHEWAAVQAGADAALWLECPSCKLVRGRFIYQYENPGPHWVCGCGCDLYHITRDGAYCPNCGTQQRFPE